MVISPYLPSSLYLLEGPGVNGNLAPREALARNVPSMGHQGPLVGIIYLLRPSYILYCKQP